jgi:CHAD domain-containing protein
MEPDYVKLKEIKPVLTGYILEARSLLKSSDVPDDKTVHDMRVLMKKSRAALKLVSPQIDHEPVKRDISDLREVGRILCSWRETSVHRKTLKELRKEFPDIFVRLSNDVKLSELMKKPDEVNELPEEQKTALERIDEILVKTGYRLRFRNMKNLDPHSLIRELEHTFSIVRDIYLTCRNNPKPVNIHEFRKKSKDFLYQLYFFRPLNPSGIKILEKRLDIITRNLGKSNDLTQLLRSLEYKYQPSGNYPALDELAVKIREKQDSYMSKVWPNSYNIFCPGQNFVNVLGFRVLMI